MAWYVSGMMSVLRKYFEFVRFSHTLFALPFALAAMMVAAKETYGWPGWRIFSLILSAMVCARTAAMGFNRLVDRRLDAANPRTVQRHLPRGKISVVGAWGLVIVATAGFVLTTYFLNDICFMLAPVALAVIFFYSFTKRFTTLSHLFLGLALALSVLGAWLAVTGQLTPAPVVLAVAVIFWVAGFDVIYAIQDIEFDRAQGLYSLPARLGARRALWLARAWHIMMVLALVFFGLISGLKLTYYFGLAIIFTSLAVEHWLAARRSTKWLEMAFFRLNTLISVIFLISVIAGINLMWPQEWFYRYGRFHQTIRD